MIYMYILMSFLFISCEFESNKKVYKSFDTIEGDLIEQQQYDVSIDTCTHRLKEKDTANLQQSGALDVKWDQWNLK